MPQRESLGLGILAAISLVLVGIVVAVSVLGSWAGENPEADRHAASVSGAAPADGLRPTTPEGVDGASGTVSVDREIVSPATAAAQPDPVAAYQADVAVSAPPNLRGSIETLAGWLRERKQRLNAELQMPTRSWQVLHEKIVGLEAVLGPMEGEMDELVSAISDDRWHRGQVEYFVNPRSLTNAAARRAAEEQLGAARRPTQEGQIVIQGGAADRSYVIRVNMEDSSVLHGLALKRWSLLDDLILQLSVLALPHELATKQR